MAKTIRTLAFIDGYNLYHGIDTINIKREGDWHHLKWLNLRSLINEFTTPNVHKIVGVRYFTAFAGWREESNKRHKKYVRALDVVGVEVIEGRFKSAYKKCSLCGAEHEKHEEKETDVNIALHMLDAAYRDEFDLAILMTGDTDLVPAIRMLKSRFSEKKIKVIAPPYRGNHQMRHIGDKYRVVELPHIEKNLLPDMLTAKNGERIVRPDKYAPPDESN